MLTVQEVEDETNGDDDSDDNDSQGNDGIKLFVAGIS
jgi:hypothetical protein